MICHVLLSTNNTVSNFGRKMKSKMKTGKTSSRCGRKKMKKNSDLLFDIYSRKTERSEPCTLFSLVTDDVLEELGKDSFCDELKSFMTDSNDDSNENTSSPTIERLVKEPSVGLQGNQILSPPSIHEDASSCEENAYSLFCEPPDVCINDRSHSSPKSTPANFRNNVFGFSPDVNIDLIPKNTPHRIALSLGATIGEQSWSASMETPSRVVQREELIVSIDMSNFEATADNINEKLEETGVTDEFNGQPATQIAGEFLLVNNCNSFSESCEENKSPQSVSTASIVQYKSTDEDKNTTHDNIVCSNDHLEVPITEIAQLESAVFESKSTVDELLCEVNTDEQEAILKSADADLDEVSDQKKLCDVSNGDEKIKLSDTFVDYKEPPPDDPNILKVSEIHCKNCCSKGATDVLSNENELQSNGAFYVLLNDVPPGMYQVMCNEKVHLTTTNDLHFNQNIFNNGKSNENISYSSPENKVTCDEMKSCAIENIEEAKNTFDKDECENGKTESSDLAFTSKTPENKIRGFSTASGKRVKTSEAALSRARRLFQEEFDDCKVVINKGDGGGGGGSETSSMQTVNSSAADPANSKTAKKRFDPEKALNKSKTVSSNVAKVELCAQKEASPQDQTPSCPNEVVCTISDNNREDVFHHKGIVNDISGDNSINIFKLAESVVPIKTFPGFSTGSGKLIRVSDEALHKGRAILNDIKDETCNQKDISSEAEVLLPSDFSSCQEASSSSSVNKSLRDDSPNQITLPTKLPGFSTSAGKLIPVSEETLHKARKLLSSEINMEVDEVFGNVVVEQLSRTENAAKTNTFPGFSTGSGKVVSVSDESLHRAKKLLSSEMNTETNDILSDSVIEQPTRTENSAKTSTFPGFCTGAGKGISVSDESLKRAKQLFQSSESEIEALSTSHGNNFDEFLPINNKNINSHEELLPKSKDCELLDSKVQSVSAVTVNKLDVPSDAINGSFGLTTPERKTQVNRKRLKVDDSTSLCANENVAKDDWEDSFENASDDEAFSKVFTPPRHKLSTETSLKSSSFDKSNGLQLSTEIELSTAAFLADEMESKDEDGWLATPACSAKNKRKGVDLHATPRRSKRLRCKGSQLVDSEKPVVLSVILQRRREAVKLRWGRLIRKEKEKVVPVMGQLWLKKHDNKEPRITIKQFAGVAPSRLNHQQMLQCGLMKSLLGITSLNAEEYCFSWEESSIFAAPESDGILNLECGAVLIFSDDNRAGKDEFYDGLIDLPGIDSKLISKRWVFNHYRWIVWKLSSLEISFPHIFGGRLLNPDSVMNQLQYRYNCEIDRCQRSIIKKLCEQDDSPSKTMILCVANIICESSRAAPNGGISAVRKNTLMELTDGWYKIKAMIDERLSILILSGKIYIGLKMAIFGCEFSTPFDSCDPLEAPPSLSLLLNANGCRKARWDARLGVCYKSPSSLPLLSLYADGGSVARVDILVARVYPMQYLEKKDDGSFSVYNERTNDRAAREFEAARNNFFEDLTKKVVTDFEEQEDKKKRRMTRRCASRNNLSRERIESLNSGEEISEILESSADPSMIESVLTDNQKAKLVEYKANEDHKRRSLLEREFELKAKDYKVRDVVPFMKFVAVGLSPADLKANKYCLITVWRPSPDLDSALTEGKVLRAFHLCSDKRRDEAILNLKSTKKTRFMELSGNYSNAFVPRELVPFNRIYGEFKPAYDVDIVGVVVKSRLQEQGRFDCVYVADANLDILVIKFWNGLKAFSLEDFLVPKTFILATNLQWRGKTHYTIQCLYASEVTVFTQRPRNNESRIVLDELEKSVTMDRQFFEKAIQKISDLTKDNHFGLKTPGNVTPVIGRPVSSSTPVNRYCRAQSLFRDNLNTSESPVREASDVVDKKLKALEKYGEPPSLLPLIRANCSGRKGFKPPLKNNS